MKPSFFVFGIMALVATFLLGTRFTELRGTSARPAESSIEDQVHRLDLQRTCAEQADKSFHLGGYQPKQDVINSYTNHYNAKLGKCFILLNIYDASTIASKGTVSTFQELQDAFEGTIYGDFFLSHDTKAPPPGTDHFVMCKMTPPGDKQELCSSQEQWDALVKRYMRDG